MAILSANFKASNVLVLSFIGEKAYVFSISPFEHYTPLTHYFYIKIVTDVVHLEWLRSYNVVYIFKNTQKKIKYNILIMSTILVNQHHSGEITGGKSEAIVQIPSVNPNILES